MRGRFTCCRPEPKLTGALGIGPRNNGFETDMLARTAEPYVAVRAKGRSRQVLGITEPSKL
ncbi:MAG: hypothetical protein M3305_06605 [Actinomycetota bacterium]|nr:hypothetical protein [Actinomycetota bacterium]